MEDVTCVGLIPAEQTVDPDKGLNVLVMAVNHAGCEARATIRLFGSLSDACRVLTEKNCVLLPGEHAHLYFHIGAECFRPEFWNGEDCEEMTLFAGTDRPQTSGKLVFIQM